MYYKEQYVKEIRNWVDVSKEVQEYQKDDRSQL